MRERLASAKESLWHQWMKFLLPFAVQDLKELYAMRWQIEIT